MLAVPPPALSVFLQNSLDKVSRLLMNAYIATSRYSFKLTIPDILRGLHYSRQ